MEKECMKRIKLIISYDGTNYVGWQIQKNGIAIEQVINEELSKLLKEDITIIGASRTDSGVHALGNVAVFDTNTRITPEKIMSMLPDVSQTTVEACLHRMIENGLIEKIGGNRNARYRKRYKPKE